MRSTSTSCLGGRGVFGGGAAFDANGLLGAPTYPFQGGSYGNVGAAFGRSTVR